MSTSRGAAQSMVYKGIPDLFYGLNEINKCHIVSCRPSLNARLLRVIYQDTEDSLCSSANRLHLLSQGVSYVSLEKGIDASGVPKVPGDLLHTMSQQKINLENSSFPFAADARHNCISECPRFWIVLINPHKVDFDTNIFDFFDSNLVLGVVEKSDLENKITDGKCLCIVRFSNDGQDFEIVSCVLFVLGTDCIYCPYIATSVHTLSRTFGGPTADGLPYRRR